LQLAAGQAALRRRRFQNRTVAGPQILRIPALVSMVILIVVARRVKDRCVIKRHANQTKRRRTLLALQRAATGGRLPRLEGHAPSWPHY